MKKVKFVVVAAQDRYNVLDSLGLHHWFIVPLPTATRPIFTLGITLIAWLSIKFYYLLVTLCHFCWVPGRKLIMFREQVCTLSHMRVDHMWGRWCTFPKHGILSPIMNRWRPTGHEFFMLLPLLFFLFFCMDFVWFFSILVLLIFYISTSIVKYKTDRDNLNMVT